MTTAFVLSGGGSLGSVQVGMLQALAQHGVVPDLLVGTSAGALNAAYVAGHGSTPAALDGLAESWASVRRRDIFPVRAAHMLVTLGGARGALCTNAGLRRLIADHLTFDRLEDAAIPLHVIATDLLTGGEVVLSTGDARTAVLASASIPGVLPAVERDGRTLVDGGLANNTAISQAVAMGADRVIVLPAGYACALPAPPRSALSSAVQAVSVLIQQRLTTDLVTYAEGLDLVVVPSPCPVAVSPVDFGQARELVRAGRETVAAWIDSGGLEAGRSRTLAPMHHHG